MEIIKNRWEMDNNTWNEDFYSEFIIQEVEEDGETYFDVLDSDEDLVETFHDYREAVEWVNTRWEEEKEKEEEEIFIPDSIESLGLQGLFGV